MKNENAYLIICLRHGFWQSKENLMFWGKNSSGYYSDLAKAQLYTKEEALNICSNIDDCFIPIKYTGLTIEEFNNIKPHKALSIVVYKTPEICRYINLYTKIKRNIEFTKSGIVN
jgi:hypothetical protein